MDAKKVLLVCAMPLMAVAEPIDVGTLETRELVVDSTTVQAERVTVAPRGAIDKSGEGQWTLPADLVPQSWPISIGARSGEVVVKAPTAGASPAIPDVSAILAKAALWLEADTNLVLSGEDVREWRDARETGDGTPEHPYLYPRAISQTDPVELYPKTCITNGYKTVYFNGMRSGSWMQIVDKDGNKKRISNLTNVFFVAATYIRTGYILGTTGSGDSNYCFGNGEISVPSTSIWKGINGTYTRQAHTYLNGDEVDGMATTGYPKGFCLVDAHLPFAGGFVDCLMNDRDLNKTTPSSRRQGGEHVSAIVLFSCELTESERMQLECHFMRKYALESSPSFKLRADKGARITVDESAADAAPLAYDFSGAGVLRVVGSDDYVLPSVQGGNAARSGANEFGTGTVSARWTPPITIESGKRITATDSDANGLHDGLNVYTISSDAGAGTAIKSGVADVCLRYVDASVTNLVVNGGTLTLSTPMESEVSATVPNGDFETTLDGFDPGKSSWDCSKLSYMNCDKIAGWEITQAPVQGSQKRYSGFTTKYQNPLVYNRAWSESGRVQCYLSSTGATVSTTFVPAAGTWRLAAKSSNCQWNNNPIYTPVLVAEAVIGDVTNSLGSLTVADYRLQERVWPGAFMADGSTAVTLRIFLGPVTTTDVQAVLDDVRLVAVDELVENGSFEDGSVWTFHNYSPSEDDKYGRRSVSGFTPNIAWHMHNCFGSYICNIVRTNAISQRVVIPAAGSYRFSVYGQARTHDYYPGRTKFCNPVDVSLVQNGVTNNFFTFTPSETNFTEYACTFRVETPGEYELLLAGTKDGYQVDTATTKHFASAPIDGVSLRRLNYATETPELPNYLNIAVAEGATLNLDFPGTNIVELVRYAGSRCGGVISAETHPEFVTGSGALFVKPKGMTIIVR